MTLGMNLGTKLNADLVIASDPDADRLAIVCRNAKGEWEILNGNQTSMMFFWYIISNKKKLNQLKGNESLPSYILEFKDILEPLTPFAKGGSNLFPSPFLYIKKGDVTTPLVFPFSEVGGPSKTSPVYPPSP